jgi:hypothetical protein
MLRTYTDAIFVCCSVEALDMINRLVLASASSQYYTCRHLAGSGGSVFLYLTPTDTDISTRQWTPLITKTQLRVTFSHLPPSRPISCYCYYYPFFLTFRMTLFDGFAKLQKATIAFVMSVRPSVRPQETTRLPLDEFSWNLICKYFSKIWHENSSFIKIWQE